MARPPEPYIITALNPTETPMAKAKKKPAKKKAAKKKAAKKKPAKKKAPKKNPAKKKAAKKKPAKKKKAAKKKPAKKNPSKKKAKKKVAAKKKKKKKAPGTSKKNPTMSIDLKRPFQNLAARTVGQVVAAAVVTKWGDPVTGPYSSTTGGAWTIKNYILAAAASAIAGEAIARFGGKKGWGQQVYDGGMELTATKAIWTELVQRVPMMKAYLGTGQQDPALQRLMAAGKHNDVIDGPGGNRWVNQNGTWVSMQGADPYTPKELNGDPYTPKELNGTLTEKDYLGGTLTQADYLDGLTQKGALGHLMNPKTTRAQTAKGQWTGTGSSSLWHAAYQQ